ncbi:hypothetical protein OMW55_04880 [Sphingomonas sp. BN140010]|uniref:Glycosyltransferase RgtA/B/C/D-like domain-containing protein n=1 Tax=Sphingomonas arvum TaxID=2992113 RepID=A0ABT3JE95_9SPHN|nr:hypothetical protein [Sphingomonas sp. BN140010]MCW3797141.1 hypothetical protein [Sphingomonas sp. BN140010]
MFPVGNATWQEARGGPAWLLALGCALFAAMLQSLFIPLDADVSWLITVCEAVLSGKRLYVDIVEVNPPASVWLYLPWVGLAQLLKVRPEAVIAAAMCAGALLSLRATLAITARLPQPPQPVTVAAAIGFTGLILPGGLFAQREHIALLIALPTLAAIALLGDRGRLAPRTAILAGLGAGLIVCIKPHFLLALLLPTLWASRRLRSPAAIFPSLAAAGVPPLLYAGATLLWAPGFVDLLPMLSATYLPMHAPWTDFLISPLLTVPAVLVVSAILLRTDGGNGLAPAWLLGGVGFAFAGLLQWKVYANHSLPGYGLAFAAVIVLLADRRGERSRRRLIGAGVGVLAAAMVSQTATILPQPGLAEAIRRVGPPRPTLITLGCQLVTGHPAVRHVDGRWVGSRAALFTAAGARFVGVDRPGVRRWYDQDLALFAADVRRERPDIVLVETTERAWLLGEPTIHAVMRDYRPVTRTGDIQVWRRR